MFTTIKHCIIRRTAFTALLMDRGTRARFTEGTLYIFSRGETTLVGARTSYYKGFGITHRHTAIGRTPLEEVSTRQTDIYLTTHVTHKRHTYKPKV